MTVHSFNDANALPTMGTGITLLLTTEEYNDIQEWADEHQMAASELIKNAIKDAMYR